MEWQDEAIVLAAGRFGEHDAIIDVMTEQHGRSRGFIKGGMGRRNKAQLQPGNRLSVNWRARLETNLGRFQVELLHSPLGTIIGDGGRMAALSAVLALILGSMPERENHTAVYGALKGFLDLLEAEEATLPLFGGALAKLELGVLRELGYGLDLGACAATGATEGLIYVSPKSGRAVCREAGLPYRDKLLPLPAFLTESGGDLTEKLALEALNMTGFFMNRSVWVVTSSGEPDARERFLSRLHKAQK